MSEAAARVLRWLAAPRFYLGEPVALVEDLGCGWVIAEWRDGRRWRHWRDQLRLAPFGAVDESGENPGDAEPVCTPA